MRARAMARLLLMSVLVVGVPAAATTGSPDAWAEPGGSVDSGSLDGVDPRDLDYGSLGGVDPRDLDFVGSIGGGVQPPRVQQCDEETRSGGRGVTETRYMLGRPGPTRFTLRYDTLDQADEIRVFYQGRLIHNTGYAVTIATRARGVPESSCRGAPSPPSSYVSPVPRRAPGGSTRCTAPGRAERLTIVGSVLG